MPIDSAVAIVYDSLWVLLSWFLPGAALTLYQQKEYFRIGKGGGWGGGTKKKEKNCGCCARQTLTLDKSRVGGGGR